MAWRYRKRLKIIPGVHLNLSKSGVSATIGVRGMSVTYGNKGTYANIGIPGTGIYNRFKISDNTISQNEFIENETSPNFTPIISSDILTVSSPNMEGVKELIVQTRAQRLDIRADIKSIKKKIRCNLWCQFLMYSLYPIVKHRIKLIKNDLKIQGQTVLELEEQLKTCYVNLDIDFEPEILNKYQNFITSFRTLSQSQKIWHIISARNLSRAERIQERTSAGSHINRVEVEFGLKSLPEIKTEYEVLWLQNRNGHDLYFYPNFLIVYSSQEKYAIVDYADLQLIYRNTTFIETESVPRDSKIVRYTWNKVNKNGTPDRRFRDNYQIPVVAYGEIFITNSAGLQEEYHCSNDKYTQMFVETFSIYKESIHGMKSFI